MKICFDLVIEQYIKMPVDRISHKPEDKYTSGYSKQVVSKSQNPPGRKAKPRYGETKKVLQLQQPGTFQSLPPNLSLQTPNAMPSSIHQINFCGDTGNGAAHLINHPLGSINGISPKAATTVKHSQNPGPHSGNFLAMSDNQSPNHARGSKRNGFFTAQQNSQSPNKKTHHQQQTLTIPTRQLVGSQFKRSKQLIVKTIKRDQERIDAASNNNGQYTTLSSADNEGKSVSQDPIGIRVQGKRQLTFASKKVVNVHSTEAPRKDNLASGGVLLQDNHRRRLQALAQAQHNQFTSSNTNSDGSQEPFMHGAHQTNGSGNSSNLRNFKVINKKLITFSSSKKTNRHGANFASQTSTIIKDMPPVQHNSVMARFETNANDIKKVNNIQANSALNSHRNTLKAEAGQIPQSVKSGQRAKVEGNLNIRQEKSPMQPGGTSQPATSRKFTQIQGSLGYRRHQIIQDITDEASPSATLTKRPSQKHLTHQTSDSSIKSFNQITQSLAHMKVKQPDLANMFYKKANEKSSDGSSLRNSKTSLPAATNVNVSQNQQSTQFNFTKKAMILSNVDSASTSRERTIRLKKQPQHSQLQNTTRFKERVADGSKIASQYQSGNAVSNQNGLIPQVGKRRPLIIRKNNFVQKEQDLNSDVNSSDARGMDMVIRANDSNEVSLDGVTSVERKLNNTQKIHMKGDAAIGSDQSLSMTRNNPFGNTGTFNTNTNNSLLDGTFRTPHAHQTDIRAGLNEMVINRKASQSGIEQSNLNQLNTSRLFKVNKSKKKLDTARRSRIKELAEMGDVPSQQVIFAQLQGLGPSTTMSQAHGRGIPQLIKNASQENSLASTAIVNLSKESSALLKTQVPTKQIGGTVCIKQSTRSSKMSKTMKSKEELNPKTNALGDTDKEHTQPDEQKLQKDPSAQPGIRPVRLFNYATTANLKPETSQNQSHAGMPQTGPIVANRAIAAGETDGTVTSRVGGQKTPSSSKSQKPLRRGQIFRKQNEKSKYDGSSATSKERAELTAREGTTEKLTVHSNSMTDPSAISSSKQLPLKDNRRSNHLLNRSNQLEKQEKKPLLSNQNTARFESERQNSICEINQVLLIDNQAMPDRQQPQATQQHEQEVVTLEPVGEIDQRTGGQSSQVMRPLGRVESSKNLHEDSQKSLEPGKEQLVKMTERVQVQDQPAPLPKVYEPQDVQSKPKGIGINSASDDELVISSDEVTEEPTKEMLLKDDPMTPPEAKVPRPFETATAAQAELNIQSNQRVSQNEGSASYKASLVPAKQMLSDQGTIRLTADTSNRKTVSNQRTYCNSSSNNAYHAIGTAFSFKSHNSNENSIEQPKFPMSPDKALVYFQNQLTDYEKREIKDYPEIYFVGAPTAQKIQGSSQLEYNFGYDDEKGDYKIITHDHIGFRYEVKSFLGKGSFGTAIKCIDHKTQKEVCIKVVKNKKKYYYQAGVELKILQFLKENDPEDIMNVIHLNDYVIFRKHLCIGFELMSMNLFEFLKINDFNGFDHNLIRRFAIQLLYALKYLKMFQIIHCDLKPENILLKEPNKSGIKIIDFGSSTFHDERVYTYIQSRFYRAPEIMLGIPYDCAIDMWSFGCIMAELYIGYPIFPGDSENDQMSRLIEMVGVPNRTVLSVSSRKDKFFNKAADGVTLEPIMMKNSRGKYRKPMGKPLAAVIGDEDADFTDFVQKCLEWNPSKRLTPDQALKHVWVLKGLPPQVLIHHQKMHNIETPELPPIVLEARNEFMEMQQQQQPDENLQQENQAPQAAASPSKKSSKERKQSERQKSAQRPNLAASQTTKFGTKQALNIQPMALSIQQQTAVNGKQDSVAPSQPQVQVHPGSTKASQKPKAGKLHFNFLRTNKQDVQQQQQQTHTEQPRTKKFQVKKLFKSNN